MRHTYGLLSYNELIELQKQKVIQDSLPELVNSASIDIRLGRHIWIEAESHRQNKVSLKERKPLNMFMHDLSICPYVLSPDEFILAQSIEIFNLPRDISAEYKLKSSMARIGLEHLNAGWCDAGWNGSVLTLELKNVTRHHLIELNYGDKIGQLVFFKHTKVPEDKSYAVRGAYNGDKQATPAKAEKLSKPIADSITGSSDGC